GERVFYKKSFRLKRVRIKLAISRKILQKKVCSLVVRVATSPESVNILGRRRDYEAKSSSKNIRTKRQVRRESRPPRGSRAIRNLPRLRSPAARPRQSKNHRLAGPPGIGRAHCPPTPRRPQAGDTP